MSTDAEIQGKLVSWITYNGRSKFMNAEAKLMLPQVLGKSEDERAPILNNWISENNNTKEANRPFPAIHKTLRKILFDVGRDNNEETMNKILRDLFYYVYILPKIEKQQSQAPARAVARAVEPARATTTPARVTTTTARVAAIPEEAIEQDRRKKRNDSIRERYRLMKINDPVKYEKHQRKNFIKQIRFKIRHSNDKQFAQLLGIELTEEQQRQSREQQQNSARKPFRSRSRDKKLNEFHLTDEELNNILAILSDELQKRNISFDIDTVNVDNILNILLGVKGRNFDPDMAMARAMDMAMLMDMDMYDLDDIDDMDRASGPRAADPLPQEYDQDLEVNDDDFNDYYDKPSGGKIKSSRSSIKRRHKKKSIKRKGKQTKKDISREPSKKNRRIRKSIKH
jgi:hypothetical protein